MARLCEICERKEPSHTCRTCGRNICGDCFEEDLNLCLECAGGAKREGFLGVSPRTIVSLGMILIFIGISSMILGAILGTAEGFVVIGFFPFLLGFGQLPPLFALFTLMMFLLPLIIFALQWMTARRELGQRPKTAIDRDQREWVEPLDWGEKRAGGEEEEIIAVSIPGYVQKDFSIQIVGDRLIIQGKGGRAFYKSYSFPKGTRPIEFSSEYIEDHGLLIIRVEVRREEYPLEK